MSKIKLTKKKKKVIIAIIIVVLILVIIGIAIKKKATKDAYVQQVAYLNMDWLAQEAGYEGVLSNEASQDIVLNTGDKVAQVFVTEGQQVKKGDPILEYDTESLKLKLETNKYIGESKAAKLEIAKRELEAYKNIVPDDSIHEPVEPVAIISPEQYLPEPAKGTGTADDPYIYSCTEATIVSGDVLNNLIDAGAYAVFGLYPNGDITAEPTMAWKFNGNQATRYDMNTYFTAVTRESYIPDYYMPEQGNAETYTTAEKNQMISSKTLEISKLETDIKQNKLEQESDQKKLDDSVVVAKIDGTVKYVGDLDTPETDGSAFIKIKNDKGGTLTGYLNEWGLNSLKVGDKVSVYSYESGMSTEAEVTEISEYPADSNTVPYSDGSTTSFYPFKAYLQDADGFRSGESVNISPNVSDGSTAIYLEKIYVRTDEDGQDYCMIDDGTGRLKKQIVTTVPVEKENEYLMITSGLTGEDLIAFPYGSTAFEGNKTTDVAPFSLF
ncbi:MAG: biotin/lipoyl-binding protein [Lachnospiraceae bacterium]|nr:biotin/lipoyl-binding protein [Lachnospiraceae bacterium]